MTLRTYTFDWPPNAYEIGWTHHRLGIQFPQRQKEGWYLAITPSIGIGHNNYCFIGMDFEWLTLKFNVYIRFVSVEQLTNEHYYLRGGTE